MVGIVSVFLCALVLDVTLYANASSDRVSSYNACFVLETFRALILCLARATHRRIISDDERLSVPILYP